MIITKKAIPRRTVLRGIGATLALPLLDGDGAGADRAGQTAAAKPINRFGVMYVAERHGHGEVDAGRGRRRLRADADAGAARAVHGSICSC